MKERLLIFINFLGIGQNKFEKQTGLAIGLINKSSNNLSAKTLSKIEKAHPNLNITWLLTGEGDMLKKEVTQQNNGEGNVQMYNYLSNKNNLNVTNNDIIRVLQDEVLYLKEQNKKLLDLLLKKEE